MAAKPESTFIASIHRHLPVSVYSMKNHNPYNSGIADVWYDGPVGDLWIEYKFIEVPKRPDTVIDLCGGKNPLLSKLQQQWLADRETNGRNVAVVVGCKEGGVWFFDSSQWTRPMTTAEFRHRMLLRAGIAGIITGFCDE